MRDRKSDNNETKHNWFEIKGDIRTKKDMTSQEFCDLLEKFELEFLGIIRYSEFEDEDFD